MAVPVSLSADGTPLDDAATRLRVWAPSRLHWGLLNESGIGGRVDGGVGVGLDSPAWRFDLTCGPPSAPGSDVEKIAADVISRLSAQWATPRCSVTFNSTMPLHVGLGAKTSLSLAVGRGYAALCGMPHRSVELAGMLGRGGTSGVGVHVSDGGGLVIEYGHRFPTDKHRFGPSSSQLSTRVPQLADRFSWPTTWHILLVRPEGTGLSGREEAAFFDSVCPIPDWETNNILQLVSKELTPALVRRSLTGVQTYLDFAQDLGLKSREWRTQGSESKELAREWASIRSNNPALSPLCLSSFGPQLFLITNDPSREVAGLQRIGVTPDDVSVTKGAATGVVVRPLPDPAT